MIASKLYQIFSQTTQKYAKFWWAAKQNQIDKDNNLLNYTERYYCCHQIFNIAIKLNFFKTWTIKLLIYYTKFNNGR